MAPSGRGRHRCRGETRMDAALDAMSVMGFDRSAIRKKVNELLKVYGGPDGWVFIEEASYKLLIEELLGGEDGYEPGPPLLKGDSSNQDNMHGDAGSSSAAGPPNTTNTSPLMDAEKTCADGNSLQDSALTSADDVSYPQYDLPNSTENGFPPQIDHSPPPSPPEIRQTPMPPLPSPPPPPPPPPPDSDFVPPPPPPPLPPPPPPPPPPAGPTTPSSQKRKPCFGWWGEETEIMHLPLMPVPLKRACRRPVNAR